MASTYGRILSKPGAASFSIAGLIARFPMSMFGISTILAIQGLYGNYSAAGIVSAANIVAAAVGAPILARLVDAHGQSRVMLPAVLGSTASEVALVIATTRHAPLGLLIVLTALGGGLAGSMGSLVRSRWTVVLDRPAEIHTAFSLEAAFDEVAFIIGPVLATALCTTSALPVTSGWIVSITLQTVGSLWFLAQRATEPAPHPRASRRRTRLAEGAPGREGELTALAPAPLTPVLRNGAVIAPSATCMLDDCRMLGDQRLFKHPNWSRPWPEMRVESRNSIAYRMCLVADGRHDAAVALNIKYDWDVAAASVIVESAGAIVTDHKGRPYVFNRPEPWQASMVCATPGLHPLILERTAPIDLPKPAPA